MQEIYIKEAIVPNIPVEVKGITIGWKKKYGEKEYGDFMYLPNELLEKLKEELCKK